MKSDNLVVVNPSFSVQAAESGSLFSIQALSLHLLQRGYPKKSVDSMLRCGELTGEYLKSCDCGVELKNSRHKCNLRTCSVCSQRRKNRLRRKFFPFMNKIAQDKKYFFYFLTISPNNYSNLEQGLKKIRKSFNKFYRRRYVKARLIGGIYVIESKKSGDSWNVHIHCVVYGRYMDNKIRGKCLDCGQNLIKFDYNIKKHYCASRKCNSSNVIFKQDSKLVSLWKQSNHEDVNIHLSKQGSVVYSLNYMLKYISANKDDFDSIDDIANYIISTRKMKLISTFGLFYAIKFDKINYVCSCCKKEISFCFDVQVLEVYYKCHSKNVLPNLNDY